MYVCRCIGVWVYVCAGACSRDIQVCGCFVLCKYISQYQPLNRTVFPAVGGAVSPWVLGRGNEACGGLL